MDLIEIGLQELGQPFSRHWMAKHHGYLGCTSTLQRRPCGERNEAKVMLDGWMDGWGPET